MRPAPVSWSNLKKNVQPGGIIRLTAGLLWIGLLPSLEAQSSWNWNGSASGYWNNSANWTVNTSGGSSVPQGWLNFPAGTPGYFNNTNNYAAGSAGFQIYFNTNAGAYTLWGNSLTMYDWSGTPPIIQNDSTNVQTVNFPVVFQPPGGALYASLQPNGGNLVIGAAVTMNNNNGTGQFRVTAGSVSTTLFLKGPLGEANGTGASFALNSAATVSMSASNTYAGDTYVNAGKLVLATNGVLPNSGNFIRLGDTSGSLGANLNLNAGNTNYTPINVRSGSSGSMVIANTAGTAGQANYAGNLYLDYPVDIYANTNGGGLTTGNTFSSALIDINAQTVTFDGPGSNVVSAPITNSTSGGSLVKNGTGALSLGGTNTYTGTTTINAGLFNLAGNGSLSAASAVTVNTGASLQIFGGAVINGPLTVASNTAASLNASISGTVGGNLTIAAGSTNVTPVTAVYTSPASGFVQANAGATISSGGYITNQGVLNLTGSSAITLGTIIGPGADAAGTLGGIQDNNTAAKTITLGNGSAFAYYRPAAAVPGTTLQIAGNGAAYVKWFGYDDSSGMQPYTNYLNGGTWTFNSVGQNNSGCHFVGVCNITNGAVVSVTNNVQYVHGTWNVVSNSSLTFFQSSTSGLAQGHAASFFGLNLSASNNGTIYVGGNLMTLGQNAASTNTSSSINLAAGGSMYVSNSLTVGAASPNSNETVTVSLAGGKLWVDGTFTSTGLSNYVTRAFLWTGGQLTAATITASNGFNAATSALNGTALTNTAGTLSPGDVGVAGRTVINGQYVQTAGGTLDVDVNGTSQGNAFQNSGGYYDFVSVSGAASLAGTLLVRTNSGLTGFTGTTALTVLTASSGGLSGTFGNIYNSRVGVLGGNGASVGVITTTTSVILTNYAPLSAGWTVGNASASAGTTVTFTNNGSVGAITNWIVYFGDGSAATNTIAAGGTLTGVGTAHVYAGGTYTATNVVVASDGTTAQTTLGITASSNPTLAWLGTASANWNTTDLNWTNLSAGGLSTVYADADPIIFNDRGSGQPTVNLAGTVQPASVTFSNATTTYTVQGAGGIGGGASLTLAQAGTVVLLTTNTYSGSTIISAGVLQLGNGATASGYPGTGGIADNSQLQVNAPGAQTLTNAISGSGVVVVKNGTVSLGGSSSYNGGTTVSNGATAAIAADNNLGASGTGLTLNNGTLEVTASSALTLSHPLTVNAGGATLNLADVTTSTQNNTGAGTLNISAGTFQIGAAGTAGSLTPNVTLNGGNLTYSRTDTITPAETIAGTSGSSSVTNASTAAGNSNMLTFASGSNMLASVVNSSPGTLVLAAPGSTNVLGGTLINSSATGVLQLNSGYWQITNGLAPGGAAVVFNGANVVAGAGMQNYSASNLTINAGSVLVNGGARISENYSNGVFVMTGGSLTASNLNYGIRFANSAANNAAQAGYLPFTGTQTGGNILVTSNADNVFSLGGYGPIASAQVVGYTLSGGSITVPYGGGSGDGIWLGADTNQNGTTTFNLVGTGHLAVYNVKGAQGGGAKQVFNFSGGTLAAYNVNLSNLQSTNAPSATGTLYNNGGLLAPGDLGLPGRMTVTGNYTNAAATALAIDIGGSTAATVFQDTTSNSYDNLTVSGGTLLNGGLTVNLLNGYTPSATTGFTIVSSAGGLSGSFTNLVAGNRVLVANSPADSFQVLTTGTAVILTNFAPNLPAVTVMPASTNVNYGANVVLSANGSGAGALSYQWYDESNHVIAGATASSLTLNSPAVVASGTYSVVVTNLFGAITNTASVTVSATNLIITANNDSKTYGGTKTYGSGSTAFTSSGLQNGETIGTVTLTASGGTAATAPTGSYTLTPSAATDGTFNAANYNITYATGTLTVNPASVGLGISSSLNPAGYLAGLTFSATGNTNATGTVVFSSTNGAFSTNTLSSGVATSLSITNLPRGTNVITVAYSGDGNFLGSTANLEQIVTNHPPVAARMTVTVVASLPVEISLGNIATNWSDADGDAVELAAINLISTNGVTVYPINLTTNTDGSYVTSSRSFLGYQNAAGGPDQISYTISDGYGGFATGYINLVVQSSVVGTNSITGITVGNPNTLTAYGVPGFSYITQRATNLSDSVWINVATNQAATNGLINVEDTFSDLGGNPPTAAFYRLLWHP